MVAQGGSQWWHKVDLSGDTRWTSVVAHGGPQWWHKVDHSGGTRWTSVVAQGGQGIYSWWMRDHNILYIVMYFARALSCYRCHNG